MLNIEKNQNRTTHLYMEVYEYYRKLILDGKMTPGSKMPSLRKCSQELKLSRTTIETASGHPRSQNVQTVSGLFPK